MEGESSRRRSLHDNSSTKGRSGKEKSYREVHSIERMTNVHKYSGELSSKDMKSQRSISSHGTRIRSRESLTHSTYTSSRISSQRSNSYSTNRNSRISSSSSTQQTKLQRSTSTPGTSLRIPENLTRQSQNSFKSGISSTQTKSPISTSSFGTRVRNPEMLSHPTLASSRSTQKYSERYNASSSSTTYSLRSNLEKLTSSFKAKMISSQTKYQPSPSTTTASSSKPSYVRRIEDFSKYQTAERRSRKGNDSKRDDKGKKHG